MTLSLYYIRLNLFFQSMPGLGSFCVATAICLASIYFLVVSSLSA
jgi:hypothetical protein